MTSHRNMVTTAVAVIGSVLIGYWHILRPYQFDSTVAEGLAFQRSPSVFVIYVLSAIICLWAGRGALNRSIDQQLQSPIFNVCCLLCAWTGVAMSAAIGNDALGGVSMHFYWWGLALTWTFIVVVILFANKRGKPLVVRDWTIYSYGLAVLPLLIITTFPLWRSVDIMDVHQAMVTTATIAFAGVFVFVHWFIFEVLERRPR